MNGYGYGMDSGGFGWIGMLLFMVVIIVGLVVLVRALNQGSHGGHAGSVFDTDCTLQIARERFARGELTKEQSRPSSATSDTDWLTLGLGDAGVAQAQETQHGDRTQYSVSLPGVRLEGTVAEFGGWASPTASAGDAGVVQFNRAVSARWAGGSAAARYHGVETPVRQPKELVHAL